MHGYASLSSGVGPRGGRTCRPAPHDRAFGRLSDHRRLAGNPCMLRILSGSLAGDTHSPCTVRPSVSLLIVLTGQDLIPDRGYYPGCAAQSCNQGLSSGYTTGAAHSYGEQQADAAGDYSGIMYHWATSIFIFCATCVRVSTHLNTWMSSGCSLGFPSIFSDIPFGGKYLCS